MNVDLPDPFWPTRPWTSPGMTSGSKFSSTRFPVKVFEMLRTLIIGWTPSMLPAVVTLATSC